MTNDLVKKDTNYDTTIADLEQSNRLCKMLMQTPHYAKMGEVGVFTIVQKAKSAGLNVLDALNGGMYFVNGKVELTSNTMNYLIRSKGHSISKDTKSDKSICILHGKRVDNGDTWTVTFSIDDAKKAGIYKNTWEKYPEDMLFNRALSRLARQLFPDVIKGCYIEGEISCLSNDSMHDSQDVEHKLSNNKNEMVFEQSVFVEEKPSTEEIEKLKTVLELDQEYKSKVLLRIEKLGFESLEQIPYKLFVQVKNASDDYFKEKYVA